MWLESNQGAEKDEYEYKRRDLEEFCQKLMKTDQPNQSSPSSKPNQSSPASQPTVEEID
jgi:L1 cell adhesion molecule like protein